MQGDQVREEHISNLSSQQMLLQHMKCMYQTDDRKQLTKHQPCCCVGTGAPDAGQIASSASRKLVGD